VTPLRLLLTGGSGQVGWELQRCLAGACDVIAPARSALDLSRPDSLAESVAAAAPDVIINAGAYTAVDRAEDEPELAHRVNCDAVAALATAAARLGVPLVHFSTDYVFDGSGSTPWRESDSVSPVSSYGRSKAAGEAALAASGCVYWNFRTSWVYSARGSNFLLTMTRLLQERSEVRVVDDQVGAPTWARSIAQAVTLALAPAITGSMRPIDLVGGRSGTFHLVCEGQVSWRGFAAAIAEGLQSRGRHPVAAVLPIASAGFPARARRPANSRLDTNRLRSAFGFSLPAWQTALALCLNDLLGPPVGVVSG
jgi:dTDP-4-dehydrorhamnose reductase